MTAATPSAPPASLSSRGTFRLYTRGNRLWYDVRTGGQRYRIATGLRDTEDHRRDCRRQLQRAARDIGDRRFDPDQLRAPESRPRAPTVATFARTWFEQFSVGWRRSDQATVRSVLQTHLLPRFGALPIDRVTRAMVLQLRAELSKGADGQRGLSAATVNRVVIILRSLIDEACRQYRLPDAGLQIQRLKIARSDVTPFSMEEVQRLIAAAPEDYRAYLTARFFSGLRAGELHGLRWESVDFAGARLRVQETWTEGRREGTKTSASLRDVQVSAPVIEALRAQYRRTGASGGTVFQDERGRPIGSKCYQVVKLLLQLRQVIERETVAGAARSSGQRRLGGRTDPLSPHLLWLRERDPRLCNWLWMLLQVMARRAAGQQSPGTGLTPRARQFSGSTS